MIKRVLCSVLLVSAAASAQTDNTQPEQKDQEEYQGPSILARDKSSIGERGGKLIDFRYYVDIQGVYDSGFAPFEQTSTGTESSGSAGTVLGWGVIGTRIWKRDRLSIDYHGDYSYYHNYMSGNNEFLNLRYSHVLKRRLTLDLRENAGTTYQANGYYRFAPLTQSDLIAVPVNDLFDVRTNFLDTRADVTWQKTLRLSFSGGATGFIVRRDQYSLPGTNGYDLHGSVAYRLTRKQTLSVNYSHDWFEYPREYGNSNIDTAQLTYSVDFSQRWTLQAGAGGAIVRNLGLESVPVDPAVTAVLGITSVSVVSNQTYIAPKFSGVLSKRFERSILSFAFIKDISPGNGVYLTSRQTSGTATYSYLGIRKAAIAANFGYSSLSSFGQQNLGMYTNYGAGLGITYKIAHDMHLTARYDYRRYTTQAVPNITENRIAVGFGYSPGDRPLAIW